MIHASICHKTYKASFRVRFKVLFPQNLKTRIFVKIALLYFQQMAVVTL